MRASARAYTSTVTSIVPLPPPGGRGAPRRRCRGMRSRTAEQHAGDRTAAAPRCRHTAKRTRARAARARKRARRTCARPLPPPRAHAWRERRAGAPESINLRGGAPQTRARRRGRAGGDGARQTSKVLPRSAYDDLLLATLPTRGAPAQQQRCAPRRHTHSQEGRWGGGWVLPRAWPPPLARPRRACQELLGGDVLHSRDFILSATAGPLALAPTVPPAARVPGGAYRFRRGSDERGKRRAPAAITPHDWPSRPPARPFTPHHADGGRAGVFAWG